MSAAIVVELVAYGREVGRTRSVVELTEDADQVLLCVRVGAGYIEENCDVTAFWRADPHACRILAATMRLAINRKALEAHRRGREEIAGGIRSLLSVAPAEQREYGG